MTTPVTQATALVSVEVKVVSFVLEPGLALASQQTTPTPAPTPVPPTPTPPPPTPTPAPRAGGSTSGLPVVPIFLGIIFVSLVLAVSLPLIRSRFRR